MRTIIVGFLMLLIAGAIWLMVDHEQRLMSPPLEGHSPSRAAAPAGLGHAEEWPAVRQPVSTSSGRVAVPAAKGTRRASGGSKRKRKRPSPTPRHTCVVRVTREAIGGRSAPGRDIEVSLYQSWEGSVVDERLKGGVLGPTAKGRKPWSFLASATTNRQGMARLMTTTPGPWLVYASDGLHGMVQPAAENEAHLRFPGRGIVEVYAPDSHFLPKRIVLCLVPTFVANQGEVIPQSCVSTASEEMLFERRAKCYRRRAGEGHYELRLRRRVNGAHCLVGDSLGVVRVVTGQTTRVDCDLGFLEPGSLEVQVTSPVHGGRGVEVRATAIDVEFATNRTMSAKTNEAGVARFPSLAAGSWRVLAHFRGGRGAAALRELTVRPGEATRASIRIEPVASSLLVLNGATGQPLVNTSVSVRVGQTFWWRRKTDADGRLRMNPSPGSIEIRTVPSSIYTELAPSAEPRSHTIQWTQDGPIPRKVRL